MGECAPRARGGERVEHVPGGIALAGPDATAARAAEGVDHAVGSASIVWAVKVREYCSTTSLAVFCFDLGTIASTSG